jgi:hypothetical protein
MLNNLMHEIGEDADLLTRPDAWLEEERRATAAELDEKAQELRALLLAQRIKRFLQQKNMVAVRELLSSTDGKIKEIVIKIMNLPDALHILSKYEPQEVQEVERQLIVWSRDGYDLSTSATLRTT